MTAIPENIISQLQEVINKSGYTMSEAEQAYERIFNDDFVQHDESFTSLEARQEYAAKILWSELISKPPTQDYEVIPVGYSGQRVSKDKKNKTSEIFVITKGDNGGPVLKRIVMRGETASLAYKNISVFQRYIVKLSKFANGSSDLSGDARCIFKDPIEMDKKMVQYVLNGIPAVPTTIADAPNHLSAMAGTYVNNLDWRKVRGIVTRSNSGKRKTDDTEWGMYNIVDETVDRDSQNVTPDGRVLPPGLSVWLDPSLIQYAEGSECDFYGTITKNAKDGTCSMTAYLVYPVHVRRII